MRRKPLFLISRRGRMQEDRCLSRYAEHLFDTYGIASARGLQ